MTFRACFAILLSMIIARRLLTVNAGSMQHIVEVRVFAPVASGVDFSCSYEIDWPGHVERMAVFGIDSAQALILELSAIGSALYASDYHEKGQLKWTDEGRGYGFPVASTLRDLLVGYDARFF